MWKVNTDRLYYTDCYLASFDARIVEMADNGSRIYLDRTAFYPTSGGQPHDLGTLAGQPVLDVIDEDEQIAHILAAPLEGGIVRGEIDWRRRYDHMQQHTGQHLLSAVFVELFGFETSSFHLGAELSTIELGTSELTDTQVDQAELRANEIAREARAVNIRFENAEEVENLRKPSGRAGTLRIVEIQAIDRSACGGTHVRSTAELAPIQIRKLEKIRGNVRLEFVCGLRAVQRAKADFRTLAVLSRQSGAAFDRLPEHLASLRERLTDAEKTSQKTALTLAQLEGETLYHSTEPSADGLRRALFRAGAIDAGLRAKAQVFASGSKALALAIATDPPGVLIAASPDSGLNAGGILKEAVGRGGGSPSLAQGSLPNADVAERLKIALGFSSGTEWGNAAADAKQDQSTDEKHGRKSQ